MLPSGWTVKPSSALAAASWTGSSRGVVPASVAALSAVAEALEPQAADASDELPQAAVPQAAVPQAAEPQAAEPQAAEPHAAEPQAAEPQAAEPHAASNRAALPHAAASKTGVGPPLGSATRNRLRARFGFGGLTTAAAADSLAIPTPVEKATAFGVAFATSISAPLT